jgi:molybdopterin-guanine dinucleotide biosynthesis protein A
MPFMTEDFLLSLCDHIEPGCGVVPKIHNRAEPLAAIYPQEAAGEVRAALSGTDYSLQTLTSRLAETGKLRAIPVTEGNKKLFLNVNTLADLATL